jgi:myo-inositol-1(or 4)-monophosphatase
MVAPREVETVHRIELALEAASSVLRSFTAGAIEAKYKANLSPVTEADHAIDAVLRSSLLREGEGWLSEESVDDSSRLERERVWVVDPLDGTREFVAGIPEFCISVAMVEHGVPVAGGIHNPASAETFLGSLATGVTYNGKPARPSQRAVLAGAKVLASRSELERGEWEPFREQEMDIRPMGSVAYKLALVAAGMADLTFTLTPKSEWDVAAGAALVMSAGGWAGTLDDHELRCNHRNPLLPGLLACGPLLRAPLVALLGPYVSPLLREREKSGSDTSHGSRRR